MNILVIGNGFDLAHGLPTRYSDFLEFCKRVFPIYENAEGRGVHLNQQEYLFDWKINTEIKELLQKAYESRKKIIDKNNSLQVETYNSRLDELYLDIKYNFWIEYFLQSNMYQKENWIDFENEISNVIKSLDNDMKGSDKVLNDTIDQCSNIILNNKFCSNPDKINPVPYTYKLIRDILLNDLNRLIRALEIYLTISIDLIENNVISTDIRDIVNEIGNSSYIISKQLMILSFNYTNIDEKIYKKYKIIPSNIDYIHGKANINNTIETNNMVLGIDEYLSKKRKDKDVEFIAFKKFYQRIHKQTGCKYKKWVDIIRKDYEEYQAELDRLRSNKTNKFSREDENKFKERHLKKHNLYIFGHSLDVTDKDILRDLILNDNVYTTIFYLNKDVMGQQIANLVKVIGQDELIKRTGGSTKTIEFKQQQDMIPINDDNTK